MYGRTWTQRGRGWVTCWAASIVMLAACGEVGLITGTPGTYPTKNETDPPGNVPSCGDTVCEPNEEDCATCPDDCGTCSPVCNDGRCEDGETCATCPDDCGACGPECDDGFCDDGETCTICPSDCGSCDGPGGEFTAAIQASRTRDCVAPCAIFFEATETTHTDPDVRPFHDLHYQWRFDDPRSGRWGLSDHSRNEALGPVTAHVFEMAGRFTVTLNVRDQHGEVTTASLEVVVDDPELTFAGTSTRCVSASGEFGGCPSDLPESWEQSADFDAQIAWVNAESRRRLLFRRGETFNASTEGYLSTPGPGLIGAFGPCATPDTQGMCSNAPRINAASGAWAIRFSGNGNVADWRIMDLEIDGGGDAYRGIGGEGGSRLVRLSVLRTHIHDFTANAVHLNYVDVATDARHEEVAVHASRFHDIDGTGMWLGANRLSLQGIDFRRPGSHTIRLWQAKRATISHNDLDPTGEAHAGHSLKLHNCDSQPAPGYSFAGPCTDGEQIVISDNRITGVGNWTVGIGPESANVGYRPGEEGAQRAEIVRDVIVERNRFLSTDSTQVALKIWSPDTTARNNLFDGRGASSSYSAIDLARRPVGGPVPHGGSLLSNTVFVDRVGNGYSTFARIGRAEESHTPEDYAVTAVHVRNNIVCAPGVTDAYFMEVFGETDVGSMHVDHNLVHLTAGSHIYLDTTSHTDTYLSLPDWQSLFGQGSHSLAEAPVFDDANAGVFGLQSTSPGVDTDVAIPVFVDLNRNPRSMSSPDLGALED